MKKVINFLSTPRNIYFSIIIMLTVVTGLVSISFSYYVDESRNNTKLASLSKVDNKIHSDSLIDGHITVPANDTMNIDLYVMSNNEFDSSYKLYYKAASSKVNVYSLDDLKEVIGSNDVHKVKLSLENHENRPIDIEIGIANGYEDTNISIDENVITKK